MDATLFTAFFVSVCTRTRLLSGARDLNSKLTVQMPLYLSASLRISLPEQRQTQSQPAAFMTSSVNSEQQQRGSALFSRPAVSFLPFLAPANCLLALSLALPHPQHCK